MKISIISHLAFILAFILAVVPVAPQKAMAETIYVNDDAPGPVNNGSNWNDAYIDLQSALDNAGPGDEIWVAEGTYKPTEPHGMPDPEPDDTSRYQSFQLINDVAVYGGFAGQETSIGQRDWENNLTILSGDIGTVDDNSDNCYHLFYHPEGFGLTAIAVLDGFVITRGNANAPLSTERDHKRGAGMYNENSSPTIANCTFSDNYTSGNYSCGGGMFNYGYSSPMISNCTFSGNSCEYYGGGLYNSYSSSPTLIDCLFTGNHAGRIGDTGTRGNGGGMYNNSGCSPILIRCIFDGNTSKYDGGAIYNSQVDENAYMIDCVFCDNSSNKQHGGAMCNSSSSPYIVNCIFNGNKAMAAARHGGAMYNYASSPTITNCTLYKNEAGCYGNGICNHQQSDPLITNCILWSYNGDFWPDVLISHGSDPVVTYCNAQGGTEKDWFGTGCIDADPLFVDQENGDFHLQAGSPCIDAGDNSVLPEDIADMDNDDNTTEDIPYDFEGDNRRIDDPSVVDTGSGQVPMVDMGADEFVEAGTCPGDFDDDGDVDGSDLSELAVKYGNTMGPDDLTDFAEFFGRVECLIL